MTRQVMSAGTASETDWTRREIEQQPDAWNDAIAAIERQRGTIDAWLAPLLDKPDLRIILTGAGSSSYIGRMLAPVLTRHLRQRVEAISTTSIVGAPEDYLVRDQPTLLISYGRSGNSPESVAAVDVADEVVADCYHLVFCCDPTSSLFRGSADSPRRLALAMPPATLDKSFAMTSSVTAMMVSTLAVFAPDRGMADAAIAMARDLLAAPRDDIDRIIGSGLTRVAFLGTGAMEAIADEAALKTLELSAGRTDCYSESTLGFRHGPKFLVDKRTLVVVMPHPDAYTRGYDLDLYDELVRDDAAGEIVRLDQVAGMPAVLTDAGWLAPVYLIWCQLLAYRNALAYGVFPDNPSPNGHLNRVVQGVTVRTYTRIAAA